MKSGSVGFTISLCSSRDGLRSFGFLFFSLDLPFFADVESLFSGGVREILVSD